LAGGIAIANGATTPRNAYGFEINIVPLLYLVSIALAVTERAELVEKPMLVLILATN